MTRRTPRPHLWFGATEVPLDATMAEDAATRERYTIATVTTLLVVDVYCRRCRRSWSRALADQPCSPGMVVRGGPRTEDD